MKSRLKNNSDIRKLSTAFVLTVIVGVTSCGKETTPDTAVTTTTETVAENSEDFETLHSGDVNDSSINEDNKISAESLSFKSELSLSTAKEIITEDLTKCFTSTDGVTLTAFIYEITEEAYDYSIGIDKDKTIIMDNNTNQVYVDNGKEIDIYFNTGDSWIKYIGNAASDQSIEEIWDSRMLQTIGVWRDKDLEETAQYNVDGASQVGEPETILGIDYYVVDVYTAGDELIEKYYINKNTLELEIIEEMNHPTDHTYEVNEYANIYYMLQYTELQDIETFKSDVLDTKNYEVVDISLDTATEQVTEITDVEETITEISEENNTEIAEESTTEVTETN
jgi:hypothetical protein